MCEQLARAEDGDDEAGRDALDSLSILLSTKNVHPLTREVLPVPDYARDYLAKALGRMAAGVDPKKALNLTSGKKGRKSDTYSRKILAASIVEYLRQQNKDSSGNLGPIDKACGDAEEVIAAIISAHKHDDFWGPWEAFRIKKACSADSIRHYYTEDRQVIEAIERSRRIFANRSGNRADITE
ncbi:hypothetical protein BOC60_22390 [Burkholderia pseudomallei]|nr:hypothetical protein BOC60_22390 [Burkholderia pseudomallei]